MYERYEIVRETGRGASAIVYLARDLKHERLVALKTLNPDVGPVAGQRFLREIQVSAGMQHPHILPTYDSGVADGRLYFVMPFVDGGSMRQRLDAEPKLPLDEALQYTHDIALALAFAHDQGVVHRDIKPENIMFYHGHACLADFGVARVMEQIDVRVTGHGMVVGTPAYMSPEQLTDGGFDGRSDVYSLACVLYEMLAGVHAFSGTTPRELLHKRLRTPPEPLRKYRRDVPPFVERVLTRALAASPESRYTDARAFASAIEMAQRELARPARLTTPRRAIQSVPRHPVAWAGSLAGLVAVFALVSPIRSVVRSRSGNTLEAATRTARESFNAGRSALDRWDLVAAERELSRAAAADPRMVSAQLALAQTLELTRRVDSDQFRLAAARLASARGALHGRDSLLAEAMMAFAARAYPQACSTFSRMRAADSLDALAWYGLGDCMALDSVVVPDRASASGWRFRSSWHTAARAYMRAALIEPGVHRALSYATIERLLPTTAMQIRPGRGADSVAVNFVAHPAFQGDSVGYVPVTAARLAGLRPDVEPASLPDALRYNRDLLVGFGRRWTAAEPSNSEAFEALAAGLESRGELGADENGALGTLRHARRLATTDDQKLRLATIEVRLLVKRTQYEPARMLADSLLGSPAVASASGRNAGRLAGLAALTGRVALTGQLRARATAAENADAMIAPQVTNAESQLFARAALGVCDDSLLMMRAGVDELIESYTQPARRDPTRAQVLGRPMSLAFPCLGGRAIAGLPAAIPLDRAQRALAAGDRRAVRAILDSVIATRQVTRPGDVSLAFTVQEAWLRLAIADTAAALHQLDVVLNAFPTLGQWAVREESQAAAVGRALYLRAELADKRGDVTERRRRAVEALTLWRHADAPMASVVTRLQELASNAR